MYQKIELNPDLIKDSHTNAIINTNYAALEEYKRKNQMYDDINTLKQGYSDIKQDLQEIKGILSHIIDILINK